MSNGVLILASDHPSIDYIGMAELAAELAEKNIGVRAEIYRCDTKKHTSRHFRWSDGTTERVPWFNYDRADVDLITPFDRTLVIDADYLVLTDNLVHVFGTEQNFLCHNKAWDVTQTNTLANTKHIGKTGLEMRWATVMYFRKSGFASEIFATMRDIRDNWAYYAGLFGFKPTPYRNDYALSIAHQLQSGFSPGVCFPWALPSLGTEDIISDVRKQTLVIDYRDAQEKSRLLLPKSDLHCMNKHSLMDDTIRDKLLNVY